MRVPTRTISLNCEQTGSGTPLVLIHGLGNDLHYWDAHVDLLAAHHRVVRWDMRGFGESDKPPGPYSLDVFARDLSALLSALQMQWVHLLGTSMGGAVAQRFSLAHTERVRSLILVSTSSEVGPRAAANWQRLADKIEREGFDLRTLDATRSFSSSFAGQHPEIVRRTGEATAANDPGAYAAAARAASAYNWTRELAGLHVPTLILQGLDDQLTPPGGAVKMHRALPRARLLMIGGAGHNLPIERPDLFCNAVLGFTGAVDLLQA